MHTRQAFEQRESRRPIQPSNPTAILTSALRQPARDRRRSDDLHGHSVCVCWERLDVGSIASEDRSTWLGDRNDEGVDARPGSGASPQLSMPIERCDVLGTQ